MPATLKSKPLSDDQLTEHKDRFAKPINELGLDSDDYDLFRADPASDQALQTLYGLARRVRGQGLALRTALPITTLPDSGRVKANCTLIYDYTPRLEEEARYELLKASVSHAYGITECDLRDVGPEVPNWLRVLVIPPVGLHRQIGLDPKKAEDYCTAARPLVQLLPALKRTDFINGCLEKDGARFEANTHTIWSQLSGAQEKGKPLQIFRMSVNPAARYTHGGEVHSLATMHTSAITEFPEGSPVRKVAPGDLIIYASLAITEPYIQDQIGAGTCPRIDIPGTDLRDDEGWALRPICGRYDWSAFLGRGWHGGAIADYGSLLVALE